MRSSFKPMPVDHCADHIDDEDERCRVRHDAFVARQKAVRERSSDFWFVVCVVIFAVVISSMLFLVFTHPH